MNSSPKPFVCNNAKPLQVMSAFILLVGLAPSLPAQILRYECETGKVPAGIQKLDPSSIYAPPEASTAHGSFGFDLQAPPEIIRGSCTSTKPFYFSVPLPEGNYKVTLTLGSDTTASTTTVRAESRRLMIQQLAIPRGKRQQESFIVNVRTADISSPDSTSPKRVKLKPREIGALDWDEKLTLEFSGDHPSVRSIRIEPANDVPTIYLAGDSTVVDQDKEPWAAWGQMLPRFFGPDVAIANDAESGETIRSFVGENRLAKIMSTIKPGDYLFIQFAHNDQKAGTGYVPAATDYKDYMRRYIAEARAHGAFPVVVTAMNRRKFDGGNLEMTLGDYPQAARDVAAEQNVPLIDLNAMSKTLFQTMGPQGTLKAFVHYPAHTFPGQDEELKDDTHFNSYGAYELARCVVQSIRDQKLSMAKYLRTDTGKFDPAHPDDVATFNLPPSPMISTATPYGR